MINFKKGNLLEANVEALVNTVNTVGVMGKGIALMFKERFSDNNRDYEEACARGEDRVGQMFVTPTNELSGPRWIINFPTKKHWRQPSQVEWIREGLADLERVLIEKRIGSVALPPLGCGNGGLEWTEVRPMIEALASKLPDVRVIAFEPTEKYQNVAKRSGVEKLTVARALVAESIRRYWVLGIECTLLEIQKIAWFLERAIRRKKLNDVLNLQFQADRYGPYSPRLNHLLNALDGSYLHSDKRIADCGPMDTIGFNENKADVVAAFLRSGEARIYAPVLDETDSLIDGFQSPFGMELLATVDWLLHREDCHPEISAVRAALANWSGGTDAGQRKMRLFDNHAISLALERLLSNQSRVDQ